MHNKFFTKIRHDDDDDDDDNILIHNINVCDMKAVLLWISWCSSKPIWSPILDKCQCLTSEVLDLNTATLYKSEILRKHKTEHINSQHTKIISKSVRS